MLVNNPSSEARERLLDTAEELFAQKGYAATTLRDISSTLGLTHASLYYHFPGGKEELFVTVTRRNICRHGEGLAEAIRGGEPSLKRKLQRAARWLLAHAPMDLIRLSHSDIPALQSSSATELMNLVYQEMILRLQKELASAKEGGDIRADSDPGLLAGAFIGLIESLHSIPEFAARRGRIAMADELIEILLKGLEYKEGV